MFDARRYRDRGDNVPRSDQLRFDVQDASEGPLRCLLSILLCTAATRID